MDSLKSMLASRRLQVFGLIVFANTFLDLNDPTVGYFIQLAYAISSIATLLVMLVILYKIKFTKEYHEKKVYVKDFQMSILEDIPKEGKDPKRLVSIAEYDTARWYSMLWQFSIRTGITLVIHLYYQLIMPLLIVAVSQFPSLYSEKLFQVHILNEYVSRPWKTPRMYDSYPKWMQNYIRQAAEMSEEPKSEVSKTSNKKGKKAKAK